MIVAVLGFSILLSSYELYPIYHIPMGRTIKDLSTCFLTYHILIPEPKKSTSKQFDRIDHLFESYANKSLGLIDPEGIEALCKDVHVDHTDVRMLILAWKMKAEKQGYFSKDERRRGLKCLGADTLIKLRKAIQGLKKEQPYMDYSSWINTSLDLNINPSRVHEDQVPIKEVESNFFSLGTRMRKSSVKEESTGGLEEELKRVSADNKKLTEMLTEMCENYNTLRSNLS